MKLEQIAGRIDADTARAFVEAARHVIDAMLIEAERVQQTQTPGRRDYAAAGLDASTPGGGWISHAELRAAAQRVGEAVAAEKWSEGFVAAVKLLALVGA